jgi:ketosteroid isomerase-like protein
MMKRDDVLNLMREVYAARVKDDVELLSTRKALQMLVAAFEFLACDIVDAVVEGERAAIRVKLRVRARATGAIAETESLDLVAIRDGKLAAYTQFFDTAVAERLMARA